MRTSALRILETGDGTKAKYGCAGADIKKSKSGSTANADFRSVWNFWVFNDALRNADLGRDQQPRLKSILIGRPATALHARLPSLHSTLERRPSLLDPRALFTGGYPQSTTISRVASWRRKLRCNFFASGLWGTHAKSAPLRCALTFEAHSRRSRKRGNWPANVVDN